MEVAVDFPHIPTISPKRLDLAWKIYRAGFAAIEEYSVLRHAETTRSWITALRGAEVPFRSWKMEAGRFRETPDAATLMHIYYRGLPHMIVQTLATGDAIDTGDSRWAIAMADQAETASKDLAHAIVGDRDKEKVHRLQVFPMIPAIQGLSYLSPQDHAPRDELCNRVARLLRETQRFAAGYTDSACDQINQIVPQLLIDQLLAGPRAWDFFYVTDEVLDALTKPLLHSDSVRQFETGAGFNIQFLCYYRQSLRQRKLPAWADQQAARIDAAFASLHASSDPVQRNLSAWGAQLHCHAAEAASHPEPYNILIRQTSAAVIAHAYRTQRMPLPLRQMCIVNNLRAACRSYGLPDEEERLDSVRRMLSGHGITRNFARSAIHRWMASDTSTQNKANSFADSLPSTANRPPQGPASVSTTRSLTLDNLLAGLARLDATRPAGKPESQNPSARYANMVGQYVTHQAYSIDFCGFFKQKREARDVQIKEIVNKALEEVM